MATPHSIEAAPETPADQERLATLGMTAAMFVHEMANPINNMYLHAQLLERRMKTDGGEKFLDELVRLKDEISRLNGLLKDFRSLAARPNIQAVELPKLLDSLLATLAQRTGKIAVTTRYDPDLGPLLVDGARLKQVFLNLIENAIEAMPDGGQLVISAQLSDNEFVVEFADSGPGIPQGIDVFEPFTSTKVTGTGLGLPIVRQTVEAFGGKVSVSSILGRGSTFRVSLPLANKP